MSGKSLQQSRHIELRISSFAMHNRSSWRQKVEFSAIYSKLLFKIETLLNYTAQLYEQS